MKLIPVEPVEDSNKTAKLDIVKLPWTMEIGERTRYDVVVLFETIAERCEGLGDRWVHF
jgi:adenylosuccinate lyase